MTTKYETLLETQNQLLQEKLAETEKLLDETSIQLERLKQLKEIKADIVSQPWTDPNGNPIVAAVSEEFYKDIKRIIENKHHNTVFSLYPRIIYDEKGDWRLTLQALQD